jgi:dephospho-CoA kinase
MKLLGLTGGIGMGKSVAARLLQERGVPVVDTDVIARQVVEPGEPALAEVQAAFGTDVIGPDGRLVRAQLARIVFANPDARRTLEGILHPRIRDIWHKQVDQWKIEGRPIGVVVIPLLFETDAVRHFQAVLCVACSAGTQERRLRERGWAGEEIRRRNRAQWPVERKMLAADFVVWTDTTVEVHGAQWKKVLERVGN